MEPMDIDWKNIESIFVKDDLYEHINAPKYIDFSAAEESIDIEYDAWFCRADCRHPKNAEDFKVKHLRSVSTSGTMPLGERSSMDANMKRRGIRPSENPRSRKPPKNFRDDSENENPNLSSLSSPNRPIANSKTFKSTIKSSAEKKKNKEEMNPFDPFTGLPPPKENPSLKSTHSVRNLFAGREILNQITEFCRELKKIALNASERENSMRSNGAKINKTKGLNEEEPLLESEKKRNLNSKIFIPETGKKKKVMDGAENTQASKMSNLNGGKRKGEKGPLQVRSCPPSPQRFPSPLKPLQTRSKTSKRSVLNELEQAENFEEENENVPVSNAEGEGGASMDVFWFLKPCTLGK